MKIKLLLVIPTLDRSGAEKQLSLLASRLPADQFDVRVVALTRGGPYADELAEHQIPVDVLGKRFKFDPTTLLRLRRIIQEWRPEIVHTWLFAANSYGRLVLGKRPACKVIVSERCVDSWKSGWQLWLDRKLISRTNLLVGNSHSVTDFYGHVGVPGRMLRVVHNGIDLPAAPPATRDELRKELQLPTDARVVGYVGRLAPQKRVKDLVWCMELLSNLQPQIHLLLIGDGPDRDMLERLVRKTENSDRVRFMGHQADPRRLMPVIEVFWLGSEFEGLSNSLMEAMAAGLPVVATDIPANRELVVPGTTGELVPVGDNVARAKETDVLLKDADQRAAFGQAGQARIRDHFSIEAMVEGYAALYREVLAE